MKEITFIKTQINTKPRKLRTGWRIREAVIPSLFDDPNPRYFKCDNEKSYFTLHYGTQKAERDYGEKSWYTSNFNPENYEEITDNKKERMLMDL
jgi:hypothetical protein